MNIKNGFLLLVFSIIIHSSTFSQKRISPDEALDNIGLYVRICEKVMDGVYLEKSTDKVTLLNIGGAYPNQKLTIVISNESRKNFSNKPEEFYPGKFICLIGRVESRNGKPQIEILTPPTVIDSIAMDSLDKIVSKNEVSIKPPEVMPKEKSVQPNFEAGISLGTMHAATDVGRKKSVVYLPSDNVKLHVGIYGSYDFNKNVAARIEINFGSIAADDKNGKPSVQPRSLHFRSKIFEVAVLGQVTPIHFKKGSVYLLGGVGLFSFSPEALYNGSWVKLQPLSTEGQGFPEFPGRKKYSLTQLCLPFGGGIKFDISPEVALRFEANYRWTSTDYLDDASTLFINRNIFFSNLPQQTATTAANVSTPNPTYNIPGGVIRGGEKTKDKYFSFALKLGYKFKR